MTLCCALGGEPGRVLHGLIESNSSLTLRAADANTPNGVYIHDRRGGERSEIVTVESRPLGRHATDELYGIALAAGLDADLTLVTGCRPGDLVPPDLYRRLITDLRANDKRAVADLTGPPLAATLSAGVTLLRVSAEELLRDGCAASPALADLTETAERLNQAGAENVLISRASAPAIFIGNDRPGQCIAIAGPVFEALDHTGAGDSMFAATGVGLARGMALIDAIRLGMAAGALNATRRGLGTGTRQEIERLAEHVIISAMDTAPQPPRQLHPPPPADDDEARFDDESSAIGHPEPNGQERPKQKTKTGGEIPAPERGEFQEHLGKPPKPGA